MRSSTASGLHSRVWAMPMTRGRKIRRARLRGQASPGDAEANAGGVAGEPDIHREGHGGADADGRPVDRADHGLRQRKICRVTWRPPSRHVPTLPWGAPLASPRRPA